MNPPSAHSAIPRCTAFKGVRRIISGDPGRVALKIKAVLERDPRGAAVLVFDDATGEQIELDLRGRSEEILRRYAPPAAEADEPRGPGRPKLGVVAREVTLLPRHWEWLNARPGGASVALRKLVEEARRANAGVDRIRRSREAGCRFLTVTAGNRPGFEEAMRALFAGDPAEFQRLIAPWPAGIREYANRLTADSFANAAITRRPA